MTMHDQIRRGLALARHKGCPVTEIWIRQRDERILIEEADGVGESTIDGRQLVIRVAMAVPWSIRLDSGWTDRHGAERIAITPDDVQAEIFPFEAAANPSWMLDFNKPMMIEGQPDTRVEVQGSQTHTGDYPIRVFSNGMSCMAYINAKGEVTSTIYEGHRVINRDRHEVDQIERTAMEAHPLWGSF